MTNGSWAAHGNNLTTASRPSSTASNKYVPEDYLLGRKSPADLLNPPTQGGALVPVDETGSVHSYEPSVPEQYAARPYNPQLALQPHSGAQIPLGAHIKTVSRPRASTESRCTDCSRSIRSYQSARSHQRSSSSDRGPQRSRSHRERSSRHRDHDSERDRHRRSSRARKDSCYEDPHTSSSSSRDSSKSKDRKDKDKTVKRASSTTTKRRPTYVNASNSSRKLQLRRVDNLIYYMEGWPLT